MKNIVNVEVKDTKSILWLKAVIRYSVSMASNYEKTQEHVLWITINW